MLRKDAGSVGRSSQVKSVKPTGGRVRRGWLAGLYVHGTYRGTVVTRKRHASQWRLWTNAHIESHNEVSFLHNLPPKGLKVHKRRLPS
jgi:hypothetical protein